MAIEITRGNKDTQYVAFGDEERMYQLLGTPNPNREGRYDFELRQDNDPNSTFMEFSLDYMENMSASNIFITALEQARKGLPEAADSYMSRSPFPEKAREGFEHLQRHIGTAEAELKKDTFDFDKLSDYAYVDMSVAWFEDRYGDTFKSPPETCVGEHLCGGPYKMELHDMTQSILDRAKEIMKYDMPGEGYNDRDLKRIEARKGEPDTNRIKFFLGYKEIGATDLTISIRDGYGEFRMPDGSQVKDLASGQLTWSKLEQYEKMAQAHIADDFTAGVESMAMQDKGLEQ